MANSKQDRSRRDEPEYFDPAVAATKQLEDNEGGGDLNLPDGAEFEEIDGPGEYEWDIVPYIVGKNATIIHHKMKPGMVHYEFTYYRHADIGPDEQSVACLRNWGERCPLCDDAQDFRKKNDMQSEENKKTFNSMKAKLRTVMKVINAGDRKPRMKILAYSWHGFAKQLAEKITGPKAEQMGYKSFSRMKGGMTVSAKMSKTDVGKWVQASTIEMIPRKDDLEPELLEQWGSVDEWLIKRTPAEIAQIRDGRSADSEEEDDDRPTQRNGRVSSSVSGPHIDSREEGRPIKRHVADKDDEDDDDNPAARMGIEVGHFVKYGKLRCEVTKINAAGTKVNLRDDDSDEEFRLVDVTECKVDVEDDDKPKRRGKDDDDDDDRPRRTSRAKDDDDDDRPARRTTKDEDDDEDGGFRGRGRDKDDDEDDKPKDEEDPPAKRGRGRPRKNA